MSPQTAPREDVLAGLTGRLPRSSLPPAYSLGLLLVAAAMVVLPALYLAIIGASAWGAFWWARHGLSLLSIGGLAAIKFTLFLYLAPLLGLAALPVFLVKPLFSRSPTHRAELDLERRDEPRLFAFVERLAGVVGAPVPDQVRVDCQVNAGAGLELGQLRREGSGLVLSIGLPLVAGLTLPQLAGVLAHEFGHFRQGTGMRLGRVIREINAWFDRVVHERDAWDEALADGTQGGGWSGMLCLVAELMVGLGRRILYGLMVLGHGISCFLSRQMEFDADQYGAGVAGSATFADTSLRVRILGTASQFVMTSALSEQRLVDDLPLLVTRVADQAPPRLVTEMKLQVQRSGTRLFDTHPSDLERVRRVRAGRFPGLLASRGPASVLFRDFQTVSRRATLRFYEAALGGKTPGADALLPVEAFVGAPRQPGAEPQGASFEFPPQRPPRLSPHVAVSSAEVGDIRAARRSWLEAAKAAAPAVDRLRRAHAQLLDAAMAEALLSAGLTLRARDFSLPTADQQGVERTRARAQAMQAQAEETLQTAERALGRWVGVSHGTGEPRPEQREARDEARRLIDALPALEDAQPVVADLRRDVVVLGCLLDNQQNRAGHTDLARAIESRLPAVRRGVVAVRSALEKSGLTSPAESIPEPWRDDPASHVASGIRALELMEVQQQRVVGRLLEIADQGIKPPGQADA